MRALRLVAETTLETADLPAPTAGSGEAVIRVEAAGVCRTDWHLWRGDWDWEGIRLPLPRTLGHEVAGTVVELGPDVERVAVGDRVTVPFHLSCGRCEACCSGASEVCPRADYLGSSLDGGWAELLRIPRAELNVIPLPDGLGFDAAAAMGRRFMTAFHAITVQGRVGPGDWVVVWGAGGGVGRSAVQILAGLGALAVAVDVVAEKLEPLRELGAVALLDGADAGLVERIVELTGGGAHVGIDTLGSSRTIEASVCSLRARGRHVQVGLTSSDDRGRVAMPVDLFVLRELEFIGSAGNPHHRYGPLFRFLDAARLDPARLIGRRLTLEEVPEVLDDMTTFKSAGLAVITRFDGRTPG
ncbi:zinc-dependent alcohol dehydrogenase family protein [soil metagenome]